MTLYDNILYTLCLHNGLARRQSIVVLCLFLLSACTVLENDEKSKVFRLNTTTNITSLDPASASTQANGWAVTQLYNGLVQLDKELKVTSCIAKRWSLSEDGLTYTFVLRKDVFFHDDPCFALGKGRVVRAQDFEYSFNRLLDVRNAAKGRWIFAGKVDTLAPPFEALNDSVLVMRLLKPFRPMLSLLTSPYAMVVPKEAIDLYGTNFREHPVGTGPFRLKIWDENNTLILTRNEHYFETDSSGSRLPYLDGVRFFFLKERQTAFFQFKQQKLHHFSGLESSYVNELLDEKGELLEKWKGQFDFHKASFLNTEYLGFNLRNPSDTVLKNKLFRQALNWGIDRALLLATLRNNMGLAGNAGFVPRGLPSFSAEKVVGYNYQPQKARALLKEMGYSGQEITLTTNADYADICTFVAKQWADIGVRCRVEVLDAGTLRTLRDKGKLQVFRASWIADYPDEENFFSLFYGENPSPPNYFGFHNLRFDELYRLSQTELTEMDLGRTFNEMDGILVEEAPVVFLYYDRLAVFTDNRVIGFETNPLNGLDLRGVRIK